MRTWMIFTVSLGLLTSCHTKVQRTEKDFVGNWLETRTVDLQSEQGVTLNADGTAASIGMATLKYESWSLLDDRIILNGKSIGNGQTIDFSDTMDIVKISNDTLIIRRKGKDITFTKGNADAAETDKSPSRKAYDGFVWKNLSAVGLNLWAQSNDDIRLIGDSSLPGIVMVRKGDMSPHMLIRIFDLPNNDINDVIKTLEASDNWDKSQTCKFKEVESGRKNIRRFVLMPDGAYAAEIEKQMKQEPVPAPCNGWGVGNSGKRYFEIHESHPDKALFLEIGQDAPLFDENSIVFSDLAECSNSDDSACSKDELYVLNGTLCIEHEVRSFKPDGCDDEFWIVDKTGHLKETYDKMMNASTKNKPLYATLKVEYNGKWDTGFAADYTGVYFVREVLSVRPEK